jgi:asparagine synthase (glutamine-hydrolysing)
LPHLRGEFAFVLWDDRNRVLFAARDRFGIKPLYYAVYQNTLYLASEIKAILAAGVPAKWDLESVFQAHSISINQDRTFYKVVLTGEGADELFAGYPAFRQDMLLHNTQGQDGQVIEQLLTTLRQSNLISSGLTLPEGSSIPLTTVEQTLGFVPTWIEALAGNALKFKKLYEPDFWAKFSQRDPYRVFLNQFDLGNQLTGREPAHQSMYIWSKSVFVNYLLRMLGDGMEMGHSVEGRLPFLDHHVVELVCQIPVSWKIRGMTEKYLLREAAKPFITDTIYNRQKHPFLAPPATLKPNDRLYELIQDTCRSSIMALLPFYNQTAVIDLLDKLPEMDSRALTAVDFIIMFLLSACIFQERFGLS